MSVEQNTCEQIIENRPVNTTSIAPSTSEWPCFSVHRPIEIITAVESHLVFIISRYSRLLLSPSLQFKAIGENHLLSNMAGCREC